ncbi:MAG: DNA repair protein NreB [Candidatus Micrarchaeota archaeon]|nr:MAG: DNA repair protein NreB [Candidatus Micrarchaeota archaeon]
MIGKELEVVKSYDVYRRLKEARYLKFLSRADVISNIKANEINAITPPSVFVGRYGYPKLSIGPLMAFSDSIADRANSLVGLSIEDIIRVRSSLVRVAYPASAYNVYYSNDRNIINIQELALSDYKSYVDTHIKKISDVLHIDGISQPFGPTVLADRIEIEDIKSNRVIESKTSDTDAKARDIIYELYRSKIDTNKIVELLSTGLLGEKSSRRLVPTRWAITAVDSTVSEINLEKVKEMNPVDHISAYTGYYLGNRWLIFFIPGYYEYESIEAWYPNTRWNSTDKIDIGASYEGFKGRSSYAEIGGCYYAARLATSEKLIKDNIQAKVLILREVHEDYILPVGVWNVREHVRLTLNNDPIILESKSDMLNIIDRYMRLKHDIWIKNSIILRDLFKQNKITDYIKS